MDYSKLVGGYYIGARAGLIDEKHYRKMGNALWLFLWCVHRQTGTSKEGKGIVMRGQPVTYAQIREETGFTIGTIRDWLRVLKKHGYISTLFSGKGVQIWVEGQKKSKRRVLEVQHPRVLRSQHPSALIQHPCAVIETKDKDLKSSPKTPKHLQDNTDADEQKTFARRLVDISKEKKIKHTPTLTDWEVQQRQKLLLGQLQTPRSKPV